MKAMSRPCNIPIQNRYSDLALDIPEPETSNKNQNQRILFCVEETLEDFHQARTGHKWND